MELGEADLLVTERTVLLLGERNRQKRDSPALTGIVSDAEIEAELEFENARDGHVTIEAIQVEQRTIAVSTTNVHLSNLEVVKTVKFLNHRRVNDGNVVPLECRLPEPPRRLNSRLSFVLTKTVRNEVQR